MQGGMKDNLTKTNYGTTVAATVIALLINIIGWQICFGENVRANLSSYGFSNLKLYIGFIILYIVSFLTVYFFSGA